MSFQLELLTEVLSTGNILATTENAKYLKKINKLVRVDLFKTTDLEVLSLDTYEEVSNVELVTSEIEFKEETAKDESRELFPLLDNLPSMESSHEERNICFTRDEDGYENELFDGFFNKKKEIPSYVETSYDQSLSATLNKNEELIEVDESNHLACNFSSLDDLDDELPTNQCFDGTNSSAQSSFGAGAAVWTEQDQLQETNHNDDTNSFASCQSITGSSVRIERLRNGKKHPCDKCDFSGASAQSLKRHKDTIHQGIRYLCDQCDFITPNKAFLNEHKDVKHKGILLKCDQCDFSATSSGKLYHHIKKNHGNFRLPCDQCEFTAGSLGEVTRHKKIKHEGIKFTCKLCDHSTTRNYYLKQHIEAKHKSELSKASDINVANATFL